MVPAHCSWAARSYSKIDPCWSPGAAHCCRALFPARRLRFISLARENLIGASILKIAGQRRILVVAMLAIGGACCLAQSPSKDSAFALEQQGKYGDAEVAWRSIVRAKPGDAEAYAHLGFLEARQERYKQAVPLYRKALALNPAMPGLRLNLGLALFKGGDLKQAIQTFVPGLKGEPASSPDEQRVTALLGIAEYGVGQYAAAVPYLKTAAANDPQNL